MIKHDYINHIKSIKGLCHHTWNNLGESHRNHLATTNHADTCGKQRWSPSAFAIFTTRLCKCHGISLDSHDHCLSFSWKKTDPISHYHWCHCEGKKGSVWYSRWLHVSYRFFFGGPSTIQPVGKGHVPFNRDFRLRRKIIWQANVILFLLVKGIKHLLSSLTLTVTDPINLETYTTCCFPRNDGGMNSHNHQHVVYKMI